MLYLILVMIWLLFFHEVAIARIDGLPASWIDESTNILDPSSCNTTSEGVFCNKNPHKTPPHDYKALPECYNRGTNDQNGQWITFPLEMKPPVKGQFLREILYGYDQNRTMGSLVQYYRVWFPLSCRLHRFNQQSLVHYATEKAAATNKPLTNIAFFGDSVLRGVYCGLLRINSAESDGELFGPNEDVICGGLKRASGKKAGQRMVAISLQEEGTTFQGTSIDGLLNTSFTYIKELNNFRSHIDKNTTAPGTFNSIEAWLAKTSVKVNRIDGKSLGDHIIRPPTQIDFLVVSSGAWSFFTPTLQFDRHGALSRFPYAKSVETCYNDMFETYSKKRTDPEALKVLQAISDLANEYGVRIIYKNNHYNCRFGALCADEVLELKLREVKDSRWEVWNTRPMSVQHWRDQTWDGLHFDRQPVHTLPEHYRAWFSSERGFKVHGNSIAFNNMAELEMQLTNTLLQRTILKPIYDTKPKFSE